MKIAVYGSWRAHAEPACVLEHKFGPFCGALGSLLASQEGMVIRVASDRPQTADRHVVNGFLRSAERGDGARIEVYPGEDRQPYSEMLERHPSLFTRAAYRPESGVRSTHLRMIKDADAALLVGGRGGVWNIGLATCLTSVRLWPVGSFGGAAQRLLWELGSLTHTTARLPSSAVRAALNSSPEVSLEALRREISEFPRIMIAHGRSADHTAVADVLREIGVTRVDVLVSNVSPGALIAEKFEHYASGCDGAIALLTPEDVACETLAPNGTNLSSPGPTKPRARQNVILELGWFWSRLGRGRTLVLTKGDVEIPSDLYGVEVSKYEMTPADQKATIESFITRLRRGAPG